MAPDTTPLISLAHLQVKTNQEVRLQPISLQVFRSDKIALSGPNGAGKTTLLKVLAGLQKYEGEMTIHSSLNLGYLPQVDAVEKSIPLSAQQFLKLYCQHSSETKEITIWAEKLLAKHLLSKPISNLSRGEFQKILFIRTLLKKPNLLLLDEPFSCLDEESTVIFTKEILQSDKFAVLVAIHDNEWISGQGFKKVNLEKKGSVHAESIP